MKRKFTTSFDELIRNYYGDSSRSGMKSVVTIEELFATYYGNTAISEEESKKDRPTLALSLCCDDGEILAQRPCKKSAPRYGYEQSTDSAEFEEYVVADDALATQCSVAAQREVAGETTAFEEYTVDILAPLEETAPPPTRAPDSYQPVPADAPPVAARPPIDSRDSGETSYATASDDDFIADMQSLLTGQKALDASETIVQDDLSRKSTPSPSNLPVSTASDSIFDQIARSMQYANAYDLGTVELENRFADFDRSADLEQKAAEDKKTKKHQASPQDALIAPKVDTEDFLHDLEAIRNEHYGSDGRAAIVESFSTDVDDDVSRQRKRDAACIPFALSLEDPEYSRPLYDAGEHVLAGQDLYRYQLSVGKAPGVPFSYGQLLAMGDLYEDDIQMMNADVGELTNIKTLIESSTKFYTEPDREKRKLIKHLDVSNVKWDNATSKRYLDLAEGNYNHYSPNVIFTDAIARGANKQPTNKSAWESYHKQAIKAAQKMWRDPANKNRTFVPERPLIINAFGDHFLTDAFASGHLINKEVMIAYFRANFFTGDALKPAAEQFFERVAKLAFVNDVAKKFKLLESTSPPDQVCAWGWCFAWHPNIKDADRFKTLLIEAAKQEPEKVANFAVKALHDHLNEFGLEVTNQAGDKWWLNGDEFLNPTTLAIMRKAVQQSIDNINDPSIQASNLNFSNYFAKVWKYVPQPTEASKQKVAALMKDYTRPESTVLSSAAALIITEQLDSLIDVLVEKTGKLRPA